MLHTLAMLWVVAALMGPARPPAVRTPAGLWPMPRHDAANTGRADAPGQFRTAPREVWRYGSLRRAYGAVRPIRVAGKGAFLRQSGGGLEVVYPNGKVAWQRSTFGVGQILDIVRFPAAGAEAVLATAGNSGYALVDLATGRTLWTWAPPPGAKQGGFRFLPAHEGGRLFAFPQNTLEGFCFEFTRPGPPRLLWHAVYKDKYWANFGPYIVLADMDKDGKPEILLAAKPTYFAVIDTDTGALKFDIHYPIDGESGTGRPYGLLQAEDIDGDGYPDAVMASCQVEEYLGVARNVGGKRFEYKWSKWVEHDLPDDDYELRPSVAAFADLNGDGRREMALGLYNLSGDKRWHTVVFDPFVGWKAPLADLPGRYCWGCYDLDGDGRPEIITSSEPSRRRKPITTLQIVDGATYRDVASVEGVSPSVGAGPLPLWQGFFSGRESLAYPRLSDGKRGILIRRPGKDAAEVLLRLQDGKAMIEPFVITSTARAVLASLPDTEAVLPDLQVSETAPAGASGAYSPLVCSASGRRELVVARTDLTLTGGVPDLARSGAWKSRWEARGSVPTIWQAPDGTRRVCAVDWQEDLAYVYDPTPTAGAAARPKPLLRLELPDPPLRIPGLMLPYGDTSMRLFVGMQTGVHTLSSGIWDGAGRRVWYDPKEGPYPRPAAAFRDNGQWMFFIDNHGKHMLCDERGVKRTVARGWYDDIPGRADGSKYVLPMVGPFGAAGETRLVLGPGLEKLEVLDTAGRRLAMSSYGSIYERDFCGCAMGRPRGRLAGWDVASITHDGVFHCSDAVTAQDRWKVDLGARSDAAFNIAAADINGDGRDEFLVATPTGELVALADKNGQGAILWRKTFDAGLRGVIVADVDGDGSAEIIVDADDLTVRILKPGRPTKRR